MTDHPAELPDKLYFKIGEVAKLVGVKPYVLRYWETEFSVVRPGKTRSKHRLYRRKDVENLLEIRRLLYAERYTIEGAKHRLRESARPAPEPAEKTSRERLLLRVREEIAELHRMLDADLDPPIPALTLGERIK